MELKGSQTREPFSFLARKGGTRGVTHAHRRSAVGPELRFWARRSTRLRVCAQPEVAAEDVWPGSVVYGACHGG